jgi:hypothetical protein
MFMTLFTRNGVKQVTTMLFGQSPVGFTNKERHGIWWEPSVGGKKTSFKKKKNITLILENFLDDLAIERLA